MKYEDKIVEEIGDKLRGFREEPPAGMFERIEESLVAQGIVAPAEQQSQQVAPKVQPLWARSWVRGVVASLAAASVAVALLIGLPKNAPKEIVVAEQQALTSPYKATEEALAEVATKEVVAESVAPVAMVASAMAERSMVAPVVAELEVEDVAPVEVEPQQGEPSENVASAAQGESKRKSTKTSRQRRRSASRKSDAELEEYWRSVIAAEGGTGSASRPVEVGLYAANAGFSKGNVRMDNVANSSMLLTEQNQLSSGGHYLAPALMPQREKTNLEHFMPVTVGVTVSYAVGEWLSLDSGLLYTNIYSTSDSSYTSDYARRRTMDYLGVPLTLSVYFADFGRLSLYGRLGGTAELCINAKDKFYLDGALLEKHSLKVAPLTFSLDAAVGATYALWGGFGLFGEVGCSYWMAPADYPENYRTVHPLSLSSRVGLRFAFN